jgi:hypothetical protein
MNEPLIRSVKDCLEEGNPSRALRELIFSCRLDSSDFRHDVTFFPFYPQIFYLLIYPIKNIATVDFRWVSLVLLFDLRICFLTTTHKSRDNVIILSFFPSALTDSCHRHSAMVIDFGDRWDLQSHFSSHKTKSVGFIPFATRGKDDHLFKKQSCTFVFMIYLY